MHFFLLPLERYGSWVVAFNKVIDRLTKLANRGEAGSAQGLPAENAEPTLDLIQPAGVRRSEVKMDIGVTG